MKNKLIPLAMFLFCICAGSWWFTFAYTSTIIDELKAGILAALLIYWNQGLTPLLGGLVFLTLVCIGLVIAMTLLPIWIGATFLSELFMLPSGVCTIARSAYVFGEWEERFLCRPYAFQATQFRAIWSTSRSLAVILRDEDIDWSECTLV